MQPLVQQTRAFDRFTYGLFGSRPQQAGKGQIIDGAGVRDAPGLVENPPRQPSVVHSQGPSLSSCEVHEGKFRLRGADQLCCGADRLHIGQRRMIGREEKMIAVVYHHI